MWLSLCNFSVALVHARLWPYARRLDNEAEQLSLFSLALQTTLLSVWPPPIRSAGLLVSLLLALSAPLLVVVASAVLVGPLSA